MGGLLAASLLASYACAPEAKAPPKAGTRPRISRTVSVLSHGARGDALNDDTAAFAAAYAATPDGNTLLVPHGKFKVTTPLHILPVDPLLHLLGAGALLRLSP